MRPVSSTYNPLENPLNHVLGRESNIRILRLLSDQLEPLGVSLISEKTGLTAAGARKALESLVRNGTVEEFGSSRQRQYQLRTRDRLFQALIGLFEEERRNYQNLLNKIRDAAFELPLEMESMWVEALDSGFGRQMEIGFLAMPAHLNEITSRLRKQLYQVESEYDITIDLEAYTKADIAFLKTENVTVIYGRFPDEKKLRPGQEMGHTDMDQRARMWAGDLARFVREDPTLISRARNWLEDIRIRGTGTASHDIEEWLRILTYYSKRQIMEFLISESPRAHRLRQSSPFLAVLSERQSEYLSRIWGDEN